MQRRINRTVIHVIDWNFPDFRDPFLKLATDIYSGLVNRPAGRKGCPAPTGITCVPNCVRIPYKRINVFILDAKSVSKLHCQ